ncbi:MAG: metallophosphoesterase [candidate division WS1 bacterium]|nr:metallophosphoesterase [candidate division WS1 bacterium]
MADHPPARTALLATGWRAVKVLYGAEVPALRELTETLTSDGRLRHVELTLELPGLPAALDGLRIGHVTDLHFGRRARHLDALTAWTRSVTVDLWAVTGDLLESTAGLPAAETLAEALEAPLGRWFVAGNNDNRLLPVLGGLKPVLEPMGFRVLDNEGTVTEHRGRRLALAGVGDPTRFRDDLRSAVSGLEAEPFLLLLAHSPGVVFRETALPPNLVLAGHTHGGQICLPRIGPLIGRTRQPGCGRRMAAGLFQRGNSIVYVSRGIGTSILPIRVFCPPEVTTLTLRSAPGEVRRDAR